MISLNFRRIRHGLALLGVAAASLLGGCVGQGEYDRLYEVNSSLSAQNKDLARQLDEQRLRADMLSKSSLNGDTTMSGLQKQNAALRDQLAKAMADLRSLEKGMAGLQFGQLDVDTDRALQQLAREYPEMIKYDAQRGMLRFASDLTFDSGQAIVKEGARQAIQALSRVLTSPSAANYEVVVEGHTDSQRISSGTARLHPTNRHLSSHRSIAVIDELAKLGVPPNRMMGAGWGEYRPLVPNNANGNTPQNRRVEIYLARSHDEAGQNKSNMDRSSDPVPARSDDDIDITK